MQNSRWSRLIGMAIVLGFLVALGVSNAQAQTMGPTTSTQTIVGPATYTVQQGDTVWRLNPVDWPKIEAANPKLAGRHFIVAATGGPGLNIYPPEELFIPAGVSITFGHSPTTAKTPGTMPVLITPVTGGVTAADVSQAIAAAMKPLWWMLPLMFLLLLLGGYILYRALRNQQNRQDQEAAARQAQILDEMNGIVDNMAAMEENRRWDDARRDGLIYALFHGILDMVTLQYRQTTMRPAVREVHHHHRSQVMELEEMMFGETHIAPARPRTLAADTPTDFVEVHRDGQRISMMVRHGSPITPVGQGVEANSGITILFEDNAQYERDRAAGLRRERHEELQTAV